MQLVCRIAEKLEHNYVVLESGVLRSWSASAENVVQNVFYVPGLQLCTFLSAWALFCGQCLGNWESAAEKRTELEGSHARDPEKRGPERQCLEPGRETSASTSLQ